MNEILEDIPLKVTFVLGWPCRCSDQVLADAERWGSIGDWVR